MRVYYLPKDSIEYEIVIKFVDALYRQPKQSKEENTSGSYVPEPSRCPVCGDLRGHSWGTGDCNCEIEQ